MSDSYWRKPVSIGRGIEGFVASLMGDDEQARINYRAQQVRNRYRAAIESVYRDTADVFLAHTNNVYIMMKDGVKTLIVYVDESIFAAELNAQRELIRLKLLELFGEQVESFDIYVSRGDYKQYHPYIDERVEKIEDIPPLGTLSDSEISVVKDMGKTVEHKKVREAFEKAMSSDLARKKSKNGDDS